MKKIWGDLIGQTETYHGISISKRRGKDPEGLKNGIPAVHGIEMVYP